jgi:hypothetical protein
MKIFCVYFDLNEPDQQLDAVINYLSHFNAGISAGSRAWFVKSTKTPEQIRDEMCALPIPTGFSILVFEVSSNWKSCNVRDEVNSWMGKHI